MSEGSEQDDLDKLLSDFDNDLNSGAKPTLDEGRPTTAERKATPPKAPQTKLLSGIPLPASSPDLSRRIGQGRRNSGAEGGATTRTRTMASIFGEEPKRSTTQTRPVIFEPKDATSSSISSSRQANDLSNRPPSPAGSSKTNTVPSSSTTRQSSTYDWLGLGPTEDNLNANASTSGGNGDDSPSSKQRSILTTNTSAGMNAAKPKSILQTARAKLNQQPDDPDEFVKLWGLDNKSNATGTANTSKRVLFEDTKKEEPNFNGNGKTSARRMADISMFKDEPSRPMPRQTTSIPRTDESRSSFAFKSENSTIASAVPRDEVRVTSSAQVEPPKEDGSSILDGLPFLRKKSGPVKKSTTKKKSMVSKDADGEVDEDDTTIVPSRPNNRLQIPSHIIDEDELKAMSLSMKLLYCNQVELLETSYKEQIHCLTQSHQRKEEILKDEIRTIQKDHEDKLQRMKAEIQESESNLRSKVNPRFEQELQSLTGVIEQLKAITQSQVVSNENKAFDLINPAIVENLSRTLEKVLSPMISSQVIPALSNDVKHVIEKAILGIGESDKANMNRIVESHKEIIDNLNGLNLAVKNDDKRINNEQVDMKLKGLEKRVESEFQTLTKLQKKYSNAIVKNILRSVTESLESKVVENEQKREQIKVQLKEFRKEFKKVMKDFGSEHEGVHKSQSILESEQKQIAQSLQNLNQWLQVNWTKQNMGLLGPNQQQLQQLSGVSDGIQGLSLQTELELKLLREERQNLTEAVTQLNVEKRKLNDEKIALEQDKYRLEHERSRIMEVETMLKIKSNDLEDIRERAEATRQEYVKLSSEFNRKLKEFEHGSEKQKETIENIEQKFRSKEVKLNNEKYDVQREQEFLEKLRAQMLCPNCLQLNPEPSIQFRSRGDGLEFGPVNTLSASLLPNSITATGVDEGLGTLLDRERKYLNQMYMKYFMFNPLKH